MGLGGPKESAKSVAKRNLIWRTWILHTCLGYVPIKAMASHIGKLLGIHRTTVDDIIKMTKPDGCFDMRPTSWQQHVAKWKDCQACGLCQQRDRICLARGTIPCDVLFIGEAPGASENAIGQPFVGPAGHLLDQIIERSLPPEIRYALTNLVACYPRDAKTEGINEPNADEIRACRPRLIEFVNVARPRLIVCVGVLAAAHVDHGDTVPCADIVHPAAILRMPLAQKQMATQRVIVVVRWAVDAVLESTYKGFTTWGSNHASQQPINRKQLRADYDDVPF